MVNSQFLIISILLLIFSLSGRGQLTIEDRDNIHRPFDIILQLYVQGARFDYQALYENSDDLQRLYEYIDTLETVNTVDLTRDDALAYWINLYNAATLALVLQNYPVKSIKDLGNLFRSPWKRKVVNLALHGELSLDEIEHDIIRRQFDDPRIHFALNCASIGCPPLQRRAYIGGTLDPQLDQAVQSTLSSEQWLKVTEQRIEVTKIFDWYKDDFSSSEGSMREFIARYRRDLRKILLEEPRKIEFMDYDWKLNRVEAE